MAQTKRKRRRKHKGTQGGRIDSRPARGRPQNRAEARQRAQQPERARERARAEQQTGPKPPSWGSAVPEGRCSPPASSSRASSSLFKEPIGLYGRARRGMVVFYVPMAYYMDRFFYNRQLRKEQQERLARSQRGDQ